VDVDERRLEHQQDPVLPRGMSNLGPVVSCLSLQELIDRHSEGSSSIARVSSRIPSAISSELYGIRIDMAEDWAADPIRLADISREV
jgi:hypothetical protein